MAKYPLHEELKAREAEERTIMGFLDWLSKQGIVLKKHSEDFVVGAGEWLSVDLSRDQLICKYLDIDHRGLEEERRAMVEERRRR